MNDIIAKAIYEWLNNPNNHEPYGPFSFNEDEASLTISVDGVIDCRNVAEAIGRVLCNEIKTWPKP